MPASIVNAPTLEQRLALRERPAGRPLMFNRWEELLFLHWAWDSDELQRRLPRGLYVDTFEGQAYLGLVPFRMRQVRFAAPLLGWASFDFLEANVRTYVHDAQGNPGVCFFALLCNHWPSVRGARSMYGLNYLDERMSFSGGGQQAVDYNCGPSRFAYRSTGAASPALPGSLEFFLVERYLLFAPTRSGKLTQARVHHAPYELNSVSVSSSGTAALARCGFAEPARPAELTHFARAVEVEVFAPQRV